MRELRTRLIPRRKTEPVTVINPQGETVTTESKTADTTKPKRRKVAAGPHTINVTEAVVREAVRADSSHCMIADAIKAQYPEVSNVYVDLQTIRWTDRRRGVRFVYLTPKPAQVALVDFDNGVDPQPFDFRLTPHMAQVVPMWRPRSGSKGKRKLVRASNGVTQIEGGATPPAAALAHGRGTRRERGIGGLR